MATSRKRCRSTSESTSGSCFSSEDSATTSSQKRQYRQAYRPDWEGYDELRGWLTRSRTKRSMAFCKLCNCNLEAKLSDLRRHKATKKHGDNAKLVSQHRTLDSLTYMTLDSKVRKQSLDRYSIIILYIGLA